MASPCVILRVWHPTTGSTGPRVGVVSAWAKSKNVFRMTRVVPLLVSPPLRMVASMLCLNMFEDHMFQKIVSEQHLYIVIVYGVETTQPVEPVVRCCSAGTEARDALRNHRFATGRPLGTSGVATEQPDRPSNVPGTRGAGREAQRPPDGDQRLRRGTPAPTAPPRWARLRAGGTVRRPVDLAGTP